MYQFYVVVLGIFIMLDFGVLACLRHNLTLDLKSCASLSSMILCTASVLAMISLFGMVLGAIAKFSPKDKTSSSILFNFLLL